MLALTPSLALDRWSETFVTHQNVPFRGTGTALVIQLLGVSREVKRNQVVLHKTEIGWAAMPLFFHNELPYLLDGECRQPAAALLLCWCYRRVSPCALLSSRS